MELDVDIKGAFQPPAWPGPYSLSGPKDFCPHRNYCSVQSGDYNIKCNLAIIQMTIGRLNDRNRFVNRSRRVRSHALDREKNVPRAIL